MFPDYLLLINLFYLRVNGGILMGFIYSCKGYVMSTWSLSGPGLRPEIWSDQGRITAFGGYSESDEGDC